MRSDFFLIESTTSWQSSKHLKAAWPGTKYEEIKLKHHECPELKAAHYLNRNGIRTPKVLK